MGINIQGCLGIAVTQPVLKLFDIPSFIDEHGSTAMSQFVERDFRPSELPGCMVEGSGDIVRIIGFSIFPCKYVPFFIFVVPFKKSFVFFLFPFDLQKTFFCCVKKVQRSFAGIGLCGIGSGNGLDPDNCVIDGNGLFLEIHCRPFQSEDFRTAQTINGSDRESFQPSNAYKIRQYGRNSF